MSRNMYFEHIGFCAQYACICCLVSSEHRNCLLELTEHFFPFKSPSLVYRL